MYDIDDMNHQLSYLHGSTNAVLILHVSSSRKPMYIYNLGTFHRVFRGRNFMRFS